ncbi:S41 family peptidase [Dorea sp. OM02-2LB]|nr:S41 family peptidase [Dorea sp. OM02-2LB]
MEQNGYQYSENLPPKKEDGHKFIKGALLGALLVCLVIAAGTALGFVKIGPKVQGVSSVAGGEQVVDDATETKLELIQALIDRYYLHDIDKDAQKEYLYLGYVAGLGDQYSTYYDEEETKQLMEDTEGTFSGIGATMTLEESTGLVEVVNVYLDSPAEKGGLKDGDKIYQVDGEDIVGLDLSEVVAKIKGEKGTDVSLSVYRGDDMEEKELTFTRDTIEKATVEYEMKENHVGYLKITEFDDVTYDQYVNAMDDLENQGMERLIIDLRSNPGGNVSTVCDILKTLLPKGMIVYTEDKNGEKTEYKNDEDHTFDKPLVVLVNGNSASASEIFTGAVQDYGLATIVGTQTYGKGVVQQLIDLQDGTCLKLTVSQYYTPKGRSINGVGIEPDEIVEYEENKEDPNADNQLDRAMEIVQQK